MVSIYGYLNRYISRSFMKNLLKWIVMDFREFKDASQSLNKLLRNGHQRLDLGLKISLHECLSFRV